MTSSKCKMPRLRNRKYKKPVRQEQNYYYANINKSKQKIGHQLPRFNDTKLDNSKKMYKFLGYKAPYDILEKSRSDTDYKQPRRSKLLQTYKKIHSEEKAKTKVYKSKPKG